MAVSECSNTYRKPTTIEGLLLCSDGEVDQFMMQEGFWEVGPFAPKDRPNPMLEHVPPEFFFLAGLRIFQWDGPVGVEFTSAIGQMQSLRGVPIPVSRLQLLNGC